MTYVAVRISGKPADEEHHYGHGKVEAVSALAETALLFLLSGVVIWEAIKRLIEHEGHVVEATVWAFGVIIVSIVVDFFRARALSHTAEKTSSHALEADALHFSSDLWSSLAVLIGLVGVHFGLAWADSVAALVVAVLVCVAGWRLGKRTIDTLTDVAPPGASEKITGHCRASPGSSQRRTGAGTRSGRADLHRSWRCGQPNIAARPRKRAQRSTSPAPSASKFRALSRSLPPIPSHSTMRPFLIVSWLLRAIVRSRCIMSRSMNLRTNWRCRSTSRWTESFRCELRTKWQTDLEDAIAAELGPGVEVETHIEPLQPQEASGREAPPERVKAVAIALSELAAESRQHSRRTQRAGARDR